MDQLTNPEISYFILLVVQALHLIHHRIAKRHISFVECITALVLVYQPSHQVVPTIVILAVHYILVTTQLIGSIWIRRLSPDWQR